MAFVIQFGELGRPDEICFQAKVIHQLLNLAEKKQEGNRLSDVLEAMDVALSMGYLDLPRLQAEDVKLHREMAAVLAIATDEFLTSRSAGWDAISPQNSHAEEAGIEEGRIELHSRLQLLRRKLNEFVNLPEL